MLGGLVFPSLWNLISLDGLLLVLDFDILLKWAENDYAPLKLERPLR